MTVEGGAIATDDPHFADNCMLIRSHGENPQKKGDFIGFGLNFRPTDIACAIGREQLKKLPQYLENRRKIVQYYREVLKDLVKFQEVPDYVDVHANMFFPILIDEPNRVAHKLASRGVETRRPWPPGRRLPNAMKIYEHILAIPLYNTMTLDEAGYVVWCLKWALAT